MVLLCLLMRLLIRLQCSRSASSIDRAGQEGSGLNFCVACFLSREVRTGTNTTEKKDKQRAWMRAHCPRIAFPSATYLPVATSSSFLLQFFGNGDLLPILSALTSVCAVLLLRELRLPMHLDAPRRHSILSGIGSGVHIRSESPRSNHEVRHGLCFDRGREPLSGLVLVLHGDLS